MAKNIILNKDGKPIEGYAPVKQCHCPELLATLKEALGLLEEHQPEWYLKGHYNRIEAAIQRAERGE